jgi:hypothetical protein
MQIVTFFNNEANHELNSWFVFWGVKMNDACLASPFISIHNARLGADKQCQINFVLDRKLDGDAKSVLACNLAPKVTILLRLLTGPDLENALQHQNYLL